MIKNEKQYRISCKKKSDFNKSLKLINENKGLNEILKEIQLNAITAQIEILDSEINEYLLLKNKEVHHFNAPDLVHFPEMLIKARILKGWTQKDLANKIKLKEQQIQKYESCNYQSAGWLRIVEVADELGINFGKFKGMLSYETFQLPQGVSKEKVSLIQERMRQEKSLFAFN